MRPWFYIHVAIIVALLGVVAWRAEVWHWQEAFSDFDIGLTVAAALLSVPIALLLALRSYLIINRLGYSVRILSLVPITLVGLMTGALTPAYAGDFVRAPLFHRHYAIPVSEGSAIVVYERAYSFLVLALTTAASAVALAVLESELAQMIALGSAAFLAILTALLARPISLIPRALRMLAESGNPRRRRVLARLVSPVENFLETGGQLLSMVRLSVLVTAASLAIFAAMAAQLWLVAASLGLDLGPAEVWLALGTSLLAGMLSLLPLGLGSSDATLAVILTRYGSQQIAASSAVLFRVVYNMPLVLAGALSYLLIQSRASGRAVPEATGTSSGTKERPGPLSPRG